MSTVHMIRFDSMPWPCRVEIERSIVTLHRLVNHSGQVGIAYPLAEYGELALRTGTLPERMDPYSLPIELARGTLDRLRNQLFNWRDGGLQITSEVDEATNLATDALAEAVLIPEDFERQTELAQTALSLSLRGIFALCQQFSRQVTAMRREDIEPCTKLGVRVAPHHVPADWLSQLGTDFKYVCVTDQLKPRDLPADQRSAGVVLQTQAAKQNFKTIVGPIWDAGKAGLPDQINDIAHFETKRTAAKQHFVQLLNQIEEQPDWLYVASGLNGIGHKFLSYPQQMQLAIDLLQTVDEFNRQVPVLLSLDHPWSERLAWSVGGAQGLQIADILLRHDVRLNALGLEINLDYWPLGSLPRDPLQWLELIDCWAQFGLPLFLFIRIPSGRLPTELENDKNNPIRNSFSGPQKWRYVDTVMSVALSRPFVHAVIWNDWKDEPESAFPLAGLFDEQGNRKPIFSLLTTVYQRLASPASESTD